MIHIISARQFNGATIQCGRRGMTLQMYFDAIHAGVSAMIASSATVASMYSESWSTTRPNFSSDALALISESAASANVLVVSENHAVFFWKRWQRCFPAARLSLQPAADPAYPEKRPVSSSRPLFSR